MNTPSFIKILLLMLTVLASSVSFSITITVTNVQDDGGGSLRQAVRDASTGDVIRFQESLIASGNAIILLDSAITYNTKSLTFKGLYNETDSLIISGHDVCRMFNLTGTGVTILDSMVLKDGHVNSPDPWGGAISYGNCPGQLVVMNSVFYNNSSDAQGGAINVYSDGTNANLEVINTRIINNSAVSEGGGIYFSTTNSAGSLLIENS
jgi:hypothetical protein